MVACTLSAAFICNWASLVYLSSRQAGLSPESLARVLYAAEMRLRAHSAFSTFGVFAKRHDQDWTNEEVSNSKPPTSNKSGS